MERRVVITGIGAITPIGKNVEEFWKAIQEGTCGIDNITLFDTTNFKVKVAAELKDYNPEEFLDRKAAKRLDRYSQLAIIAAKEAMQDSKIDMSKEDATRIGVSISSGIGGLTTIEEQKEILMEKGPDRVTPLFIPLSINNMATGNVSIELGAKGESFAISTACASSTHAIGECYRIIKHGYQDVMIVGGSEASITPLAVSGFMNIKALSTSQDKTRASIPFDKERNGFVMGEGAGVIILEELEHAKKRGCKIYAEICGYGVTSDAHHITAPAPGGEGGARAMINAIKDANIKPEEIDYINAHGTSTPINDKFETAAVKTVFKDHAYNLSMSSIKGATGHLLGAAGAVESIACIKAIENSFIPPTIGYKEKDEECDLDIVPNKGKKKEINYAMNNSLGFGGHNSSLIFKKYKEEE